MKNSRLTGSQIVEAFKHAKACLTMRLRHELFFLAIAFFLVFTSSNALAVDVSVAGVFPTRHFL